MVRAGYGSRRRTAGAVIAVVLVTALCSYRAPATVAPNGGPDGGPQLEEAPAPTLLGVLKPGGWVGTPSDVAGATRLDSREFIVTDYPFDDHGGDVSPVLKYADHSSRTSLGNMQTPMDGRSAAQGAFGDYAYPATAIAGSADIVEVRVAADATAWYVLVRLNALTDPHATALQITIDEHIITVAALKARLDDESVDVVADATLNIYEVRVPRSVFDPGTERHQMSVGAGLWDDEAGVWYQPFAQTVPLPLFDLAYVPQETLGSYWSDRQQSLDIAQQTFSSDQFTVNFARLIDEPCHTQLCVDVDPYPGVAVHVFRSSQIIGEGIVSETTPEAFVSGYRNYLNEVQPYALFAPTDFDRPHPLILLLHPAGGNHMSFFLQSWTGLRGVADALDAFVAVPFGRGESGLFEGSAEKDVFEVWRAIASHYLVDVDHVYLLGVGLGGYSALRLAHIYPDQFAAVGSWDAPLEGPVTMASCALANDASHLCPHRLSELFGNASNVPELLVYSSPNFSTAASESWRSQLETSGSPYRYVVFPGRDPRVDDPSTDASLLYQLIGSTPSRARTPVCLRYRLMRSPIDNDGIAGGAYWLRSPSLRADVDEGSVEASLSESGVTSSASGASLEGSSVSRWLEVQSPPASHNFMRLSIVNIRELTLLMQHAGWDSAASGRIIGTASSATDVVLWGLDAQGATVEGVPWEPSGADIVLHVPAGSFEATISP